jgi:preprotein translocase subunit SecD
MKRIMFSVVTACALALSGCDTHIRSAPQDGVRFTWQVDVDAAFDLRLDAAIGDLRVRLRDEKIRYLDISHNGGTLRARFRDAAQRDAARAVIQSFDNDLQLAARDDGEGGFNLLATLNVQALRSIRNKTIEQNISILYARASELGAVKPVIQRQGFDYIVAELPGIKDIDQARKIFGSTATLEMHLVVDSRRALENAIAGKVPYGTGLYIGRDGLPLLVKKQVELSGEHLENARAEFNKSLEAAKLYLKLDSTGRRIFQELTRQNIGQRMAVLLIAEGKGEVVAAPLIRTEIDGGSVEISGGMSADEAEEIALLLRSGALAAPMRVVEERVIGARGE